MKYLVAANEAAYIALERKVNRALNLPKAISKTQRVCKRWVHADGRRALIWPDAIHTAVNAALSAGEQAAVVGTAPSGFSEYHYDQVAYTVDNVEFAHDKIPVVTEGDSIISSANAPYTLPLADRVYSLLQASLGSGYHVQNVGVGGKTAAQLVSDQATKVLTINFPVVDPIFVVSMGTNDIQNAMETPANTYASILSYIAGVRGQWPSSRFVVCTQIARLSLTSPTDQIQTLNGLIRDGASANNYKVADWGALPEFDSAADTLNATYYQGDMEHPTATGTPKLRDAIITKIQEF